MVIFNSKLLNYQRVSHLKSCFFEEQGHYIFFSAIILQEAMEGWEPPYIPSIAKVMSTSCRP